MLVVEYVILIIWFIFVYYMGNIFMEVWCIFEDIVVYYVCLYIYYISIEICFNSNFDVLFVSWLYVYIYE